MKKIFTLSFLFAAMLLTASNSANAQPESFTKDFIMKSEYVAVDGWEDEFHICNVTAVYNASTKKLTIKDFFNNPGITKLNSLFNHFDFESNVGSWNEDGTIGTFTFPTRKVGKTDSYGVYHYVWVVNWKQDPNIPTSWSWDSNQTSMTIIIDLNDDSMSMNKWSVCITTGETGGGSSTAIVRFNGSTYNIVKTDLVDIVNDGEVGEQYEVYDDLVGVATVDNVPVENLEFLENCTENTFKIKGGKYKLELKLNNNKPHSLRVSEASSSEALTPSDVSFGDFTKIHVFGQVNSYGWNPTQGQRMVTTDGINYTAIVNFDGREDGYNYFSITTDLANNDDGWIYVNGQCRYGPKSNNFLIDMSALFAKDFRKYKNPSEISDGQIDFLGRVEVEYMGNTKLQPVVDFDQSNWVMLTGVSNANNYVGKIIKGKSITGTLVDKVNPTIAVTSTPTAGETSPYEPNIYIMPSFNDAYYASNSHYFFVAPKVQEYAYITWACYNDADGNFYTMSDGNEDNLTGGMKVNWDYYPSGVPQDGYVYEFDAIIRKVASTVNEAPALRDGNQSTPVTDDLSADYLVYPLRLYDVPTAIKAVETTGKVVDVKYYNLMGVESATPFNGVNIVVTIYDDGSRTTSKKLYK